MSLKVLIIEDEELAVGKLKRQLNKIDIECDIVSILSTVTDAIQYLSNNKPDLILSDIHLSDGLSFKIFETTQTDIPIIFTTAYDQYVMESFKLNNIDYLLKPVTKVDLERALKKYQRLIQNNSINKLDFNQLIDKFSEKNKNYKERFLVQIGGTKLKSISVENVAYFFADDKYTFLITRDNEKYICDHTITNLSQEVDPKQFYQVNRKYIIHISSIVQMIHYSKSRIKIDLNPPTPDDVIVSVERSPDFKKWLGK